MRSAAKPAPVVNLAVAGLPPPPHNPEAERAVLGACMVADDARDVVLSKLAAADLFDPRHQALYTAIAKTAEDGAPCDPLTVRGSLGQRESGCDLAYLSGLVGEAAAGSTLDWFCADIADKAARRAIAEAASRTLASAYGVDGLDLSTAEIVQGMESALDTNRARTPARVTRLCDAVAKRAQRLEERRQKGEESEGLSVGFSGVSRRTGGLRAGELTILAGRPGQGKTTTAVNIILSNDHANTGILWVTPEVCEENCADKTISHEGQVNGLRLRQGVPSQDLVWTAQEVAEAVRGRPCWIYDAPSPTAQQIVGVLKRLQRAERIDLLVVDHLQKLSSSLPGDVPKHERVEDTVRRLHAACKLAGVHLLLLAQLSRKCEERGQDKRPMLSDLQDSGAIEQDADHVWFCYRDAYYLGEKCPPAKRNVMEWIVAKARYGEPGTVLMYADLTTGRILEMEATR